MKEITKPAIILLVITAIAAALLGIIQSVTAGPIAEKSAATQAAAMQEVFPDAVSFEEMTDAELTGTISAVAAAKDGSGADAGYVITVNPSGFGGVVKTMVGVSADGTVTGISILSLSETPGLGARATEPEFAAEFVGKSGTLAVNKDGGEITAITSATITSRAVTSGVNEALAWVAENGGAN